MKPAVIRCEYDIAPDGEPFVELIVNEKIAVRMTIEHARMHARALAAAAAAAEQDAFLWDFAVHKIDSGQHAETGRRMIAAFRAYRHERARKAGPRLAPPAKKTR